MGDMKRRQVLQILGTTPAVALTLKSIGEAGEQQPATPHAGAHPAPKAEGAAAKGPHKPQFFTPHEYATVTLLADLIIPKDDHSGSASDAGVPEYMDYSLHETFADQPERQVAMRGGLQWLDRESRKRFQKNFIDATSAQRTELLDDIAYPKKAKPEMSHGVRFFNMFRDFTATGFFTSKIGIADLKYIGNVPNQWNGAPAEVLQKLGVSYDMLNMPAKTSSSKQD
jgi:gluconate 2-dehydrogenase gamma chain